MPIALFIESAFHLCRPRCTNRSSQDIYDGNIVVSCYRPDRDHEKFRDDLRELRRGDDVRYALMDFDQSIQLPLDVSLKDYRCSSDEAWIGWDLYKPVDVSLGQSQYNPFAFDVGTLGNFFRVHFWVRIRIHLSTTNLD